MNRLFSALVLSCGLLVSSVYAADHEGTLRQTQQVLKDKGYYHGNVDGIMGPQTRAALKRYQAENKLQGQGHFTRETAEHLGSVERADSSVGAKFENAGDAIVDNYSTAGKEVARGSKEMVGEAKEGEITQAAVDFGKGVGRGAKAVGKGTAKAAVSVGKGVKDAFDGDKTETERSRTAPKK